MPKLPTVTASEAITALAKVGFLPERRKGSHVQLKKPGWRILVTVPDHGKKTLKPGTLRGIIRSAGLTVEEFIAIL